MIDIIVVTENFVLQGVSLKESEQMLIFSVLAALDSHA